MADQKEPSRTSGNSDMSRLDTIFTTLRQTGTSGLMPFLTGGFPDLATTEQILLGMDDAGADIVEIGFPFSDPIADGPVIASSMHQALENGLRIESLFEVVRSVRDKVSIGIVAMVSESIIERMGDKTFVQKAAESGFDGLIVPDMDISHTARLAQLADDHDLGLTFLIAPTTSPQRADEILKSCRGFVYLLARAGITGESDQAPQIENQVEMIRSRTDLPIAAGFGISTAEHVQLVTRHADAAIVGSALVRRMAESEDPAKTALDFTRTLAAGTRGS